MTSIVDCLRSWLPPTGAEMEPEDFDLINRDAPDVIERLLEAAREALIQAEGYWRDHYGEDPQAVECPTPTHIVLLRDAIAKAAKNDTA